jgi:phosphohistidine phosphatase
MLNALGKVPDRAGTVLMIGHNPGIGSLASWLAGNGAAAAVGRMRKKFPTAAIAVLTFDVERWRDVAGEGGTLVAFMRPRDEED